MSDVIPPQADWLKTSVIGFQPEENIVVTEDGSKIKYDYLIVAVGLKVGYELCALYSRLLSSSIYRSYSNSCNPVRGRRRCTDNS